MKGSAWRGAFREYIQSKIEVSEWRVDNPVDQLEFSDTQPWAFKTNTVGFLPPLKNCDVYLTSPSEVRAKGIQELYIMARFDNAIPFHELPIEKLEGIWFTLSALVAVNYNLILPKEVQASKGILGCSVGAVEYPVSVAPMSSKGSDWVVTLQFTWVLEFLLDLEEGSIKEPYEIRQVGGKVYRSKLLAFEDKILDFSNLFAGIPESTDA